MTVLCVTPLPVKKGKIRLDVSQDSSKTLKIALSITLKLLLLKCPTVKNFQKFSTKSLNQTSDSTLKIRV